MQHAIQKEKNWNKTTKNIDSKRSTRYTVIPSQNI